MTELAARYQKPLFLLFAIVTLLYFAVSFCFFISRPAGGDELVFVSDLEFILEKGFIPAIERKICIPYMLLAYPFALVMDALYALKMVNVLLLAALFLYFFKIARIRSRAFYLYVLFYLATVNFFFAGINDCLFSIGLAVYFSEVFFYLENGKINRPGLAFSGLVLSFFTRSAVVLFLPAVLLGLVFMYRSGFRFSIKKAIAPGVLGIVFLVLNIPSVQKNHDLSYDNKKPPEDAGVNWVQRQYLAQLWVNEGKIPNFSHPTWEETKAYVDEHGPDSLPNTMTGAITHDVKFKVTEFFKDLYYSVFFGFRQLGLMVLFPLLYLLHGIFDRKKRNFSQFIPLALAGTVCIFSLIVVSFIEPRWFAPVFIPAILFFAFYSERGKYGSLWVACNYIVLSLMSAYGMYGILAKF